jgi:hypothetical protein
MALQTNEKVIGLFADANIQAQIDRCASKVGPQGWALIAHADTDGKATVTLVKKIGDHLSVEVAGVMDYSEGFKFDREHLKAQAEVIGSW